MNQENNNATGGDDLESIAAQLEHDEAQAGIEGEYQAAPEPSGPSSADMIGGLLLITCNKILAPKRGAHWKLTQSEADAAGQAYGDLLDKYFPGFNVGPEAAAVMITLVVFGPRIGADVAAKKEREEQARKAKADEEKNNADGR